MKEIIKAFGLDPETSTLKPLGNGLINSTYLVTDENGNKYVLQRINTNVFPDVPMLQDNVERVTNHLRSKLEKDGVKDLDRRCLRFIKAPATGNTYINHNGEYWRMMVYITDSVTHEAVTPELSRLAGQAFGEFQSRLADLDPLPGETIPKFHNMEHRLNQLQDALDADPKGRAAEVKDLVDEILAEKDLATTVERYSREGRIPTRVCHCDTKVNNVLFDNDGKILCVIDLDTVMPGCILSDYGDFLRTAANKAPEDEPNLDNIAINFDVYNAFTEGYLSTAGKFLTPVEKELLPHGLFRFAYMQAVRFLADYINGDTYFKIQYPEHNLVRARAQWKLAQLAKKM